MGGDVLSDSPAGAGARLCERNSSKTTGHAERASYCQYPLGCTRRPVRSPRGLPAACGAAGARGSRVNSSELLAVQQLCAKHSRATPVRVKGSHLCVMDGCTVRASFGVRGQSPVRCREHKEAEHVDVRNRRCQFQGPEPCTRQPLFGLAAARASARFCGQHRPAGYIDVVHKRCEEEGCHKQPVFGPKGGRAVFCRQHALAHHVDVSNRRCQVAGCEARALYGEANGSKALRCTQHRLEGHVDVVSNRCRHASCFHQATYGDATSSATRGATRGATTSATSRATLYCRQHRPPNSINLRAANTSPVAFR